MSFSVTLDSGEMAVCRMMGNMRYHACRIANSGATPYGTKDPYEVDEDGFIGEYAFCKRFNLFFDITAKPRKGGIDCVYDGRRIDVKSTRRLDDRVLVKITDNSEVDLYVFAFIEGNTVTFPGYVTRSRIMAEGIKKPNPDGTFYYEMNKTDLTQWKTSQQNG